MRFKTKEELAHYTIEFFLKTGQPPVIEETAVDRDWRENRSCFVTVYVADNLRGCVGMIMVDKPLYQQIVKYSIEAAFHDWRFSPLNEKEIKNVKVEVSVLTPLRRYHPVSLETLLADLSRRRPGVLIKISNHQALFLPQVWQTISDPADFLTQLCLKAGVEGDGWKKKQMEFFLFEVEKDN